MGFKSITKIIAVFFAFITMAMSAFGHGDEPAAKHGGLNGTDDGLAVEVVLNGKMAEVYVTKDGKDIDSKKYSVDIMLKPDLMTFTFPMSPKAGNKLVAKDGNIAGTTEATVYVYERETKTNFKVRFRDIK